jgi:hypothetical protein
MCRRGPGPLQPLRASNYCAVSNGSEAEIHQSEHFIGFWHERDLAECPLFRRYEGEAESLR